MKKNISLVLLFITTLTLQASFLEDREYTVAFAQDTLQNELHSAQVKSLNKALLSYENITLKHSDANSSISMQIMQIEDFIMEGVDILMISPLDENVTSKVIEQAYDYQIPVILLNRELSNTKSTQYIKTDDENSTKDANKILGVILNVLKQENQGVYNEE